MDFHGKVALITGSSRGIGAAIARAFASEGAAVAINYKTDLTAASDVVNNCEQLGGVGQSFKADVTNPRECEDLVGKVQSEFGKIDILVNNAFRPYPFAPEKRKMFWDLKWDHYQSQIEGSLLSTHSLSKAVLPLMQKKATGSIINITTDLIARPSIPYHEYTTAKSALTGFSKNLAVELGPFGIRVNCVAPGLVYPTRSSADTKENIKEMIISQTPLRRIASPDDVAGAVLFLGSDWSKFITGQTIYVDGGLVMK
ncbi:MAG: SDR family oxidoreductase [Thalassobaculaceae bacterium]